MPAERGALAARAALRGAALAAAVLLAAVAIWWWSSAAPTPLPADGRAVAASAAAPQAALAAAGATPLAASDTPAAGPREAIERIEIASAPPGSGASRTAVVGKALDCSGGPLAGFMVLLQRTNRQLPRATRRALDAELSLGGAQGSVSLTTLVCRTDAAGAFAFESLAAGSYRCNLVGLDSESWQLELATGEVHELVLQSPLVALTGTLFRNGAVAKDCFCAFDDGRTRRAAPPPDEQGVIHSFARPGRHQVFVHMARGAHQGPGWGPCLSKHVLIVPDGVPSMQWRLETGGTEIVFAVADRDGVAIDTFTVEIEGTGACDNENGRYGVSAAPGRSATIAALPAGRWRAAVDGDGFRAEQRELVTGVSGHREVVTFVAVPAAPVRVILRPRAPFFAIPDAEEMPALQFEGGRATCDTSIPTAVTAAAPAFDYRGVALGTAKLCFEDRVEDGELVLLPFEPLGAVAVDVAAGRRNQVDVAVEPRPFADLRVCDEKGKDVAGTLTVWSGDRRVRNRADSRASSRWLGSLPLGDYCVVVERKGELREHALRVDRPHVRERYLP